MSKKPKRKATRRTAPVGEAGGTEQDSKVKRVPKKNSSQKILIADSWSKFSDEQIEKSAVEMLTWKEPVGWDRAKALKSMIRDLAWLEEDANGVVSNLGVRVQNEFMKRSIDAFRRDLTKQANEWQTTEGKIAEARRLLKLVELLPKASKARGQRIAMECWEGLRFLYAHGSFPGFWQKIAVGEKPYVVHAGSAFKEVLGDALFPLAPWHSLGAITQMKVSNALVGEIDNTARVLELRDWMQRMAFPSAVHLKQVLKDSRTADGDGHHKPELTYEHALESCDNMVSLIVVSVKWDATDSRIAEDFEVELRRLRKGRLPTQGPGRQPDRDGRTLRGLACLWLDSTGMSRHEIADIVYPLPQGKHSMKGSRTSETNEARVRATSYIEALLSSLRESAPMDPDDVPSLNRAINALMGKEGN